MYSLKDFTPRLYQETILATAVTHNTLVVLPTGLGKTAIAFMLGLQRLRSYPGSKALVLAPTKPLVQQHKDTLLSLTDVPEEDCAVFTGHVPPAKRKELWSQARFVFSTPQSIENDIINKGIRLEDVSLIVFDEAHRAVGDYSYVFICKTYLKDAKYPLILGLTASPGSDIETIEEVVKNLEIEKIEVRTDQDADVREYVQEIEITWVRVELPDEFKRIQKILQDTYLSKLDRVKQKGYLYGSPESYNKTSLLQLQAELHAKIAQGERDFEILQSISSLAEAMKIQHAIELVETQGIASLHSYLMGIESQAAGTKVKAVKNLVQDVGFRSALLLTKKLYDSQVEHPKLYRLRDFVAEEIRKDGKRKIIIFSQYRDQGEAIKRELDKVHVSSKVFVGQQMKKSSGLSQKRQKEVLDEFRNGEFNCLVATSVAEEGLDIPKVDLVVFYEPVPSAIRTVQRRGRTGRMEKGQVVVFLTKGTRDEGYHYAAQHKEKRMLNILSSMKGKMVKDPQAEKTPDKKLSDFAKPDKKIRIYTDYREKASSLVKELLDQDVDLELRKLDVGDYLLSERVCVEIKAVPDFVNSILDGRLLSQLKELRQYQKPIVIIEGEEDIYVQRKVHPNAIRGMISTIILGYGIPVLQTRNPKETAGFLTIIARQEQFPDAKYQFHTAKPFSTAEQQEFIVSTLPGIGSVLAKPLLRRFRTVKNVFSASEQELKEVELIGDVKAKKIRDVLDVEYEEKQ